MIQKISHSCPLCGAKTDHQSVKSDIVYGGSEAQKFWKCSKCDVIYLYPITSEESDLQFYKDEFDKWMIKRSGDDTWTDPAIQFAKMQQRELPLRLPWLKKYAMSGLKVAEIGSSSGFVLAELRDWGCDCVGIEVSTHYSEYARKLGIKTYPRWEDIPAAEGSNVDLLLHYYVLEHMTNPINFLKDCLKHIKTGGKMLFEVPNGNDPLSSFYKIPAFDAFYWWRAHHWYFTPKSLKYLLDKLGRPYEIHPGQRYDLSNHIHWMLTGKPGGMGKYSHIFSKDTEASYAQDLKRNWLCDHLIAVVL